MQAAKIQAPRPPSPKIRIAPFPVALGLAVALSAVSAAAQTVAQAAAQTAPLGPNPSECEIQAALLGTTGPDCPPLPIRRPPPDPGPPPTPVPAPVAVPAPPAPVPAPAVELRGAFRVQFDFNSARIRPESRAVLDRIGAVMAAPSTGATRFRIVGHTDAVGSAAANRTLSQRRAAAVVEYLVTAHHIRPDRLEALGMGADEPFLPHDPKAAANRRVEIINLGG